MAKKPRLQALQENLEENEYKFYKSPTQNDRELCYEYLKVEMQLNESLKKLNTPFGIKYVYFPLSYAYNAHKKFVEKFCDGTKKILFLGMNPGPFGMCQTGVPFGEVTAVKNWFGINEPVKKPDCECPTRPILGFDCKRSESSGKMFWKLFRDISEDPKDFFKHSFVYNFCPLAYLNNKGNNITPDHLRKADRDAVIDLCKSSLATILELLQVEVVIALGRFSEKMANKILSEYGNDRDIEVIYMCHPSPIIPNNNNWGEKTLEKLKELDLHQYYVHTD